MTTEIAPGTHHPTLDSITLDSITERNTQCGFITRFLARRERFLLLSLSLSLCVSVTVLVACALLCDAPAQLCRLITTCTRTQTRVSSQYSIQQYSNLVRNQFRPRSHIGIFTHTHVQPPPPPHTHTHTPTPAAEVPRTFPQTTRYTPTPPASYSSALSPHSPSGTKSRG